MKEILQIVIGSVGGILVTMFGGFDIAIQTLFICMIVDYVMGIFVAGVFHKSDRDRKSVV